MIFDRNYKASVFSMLYEESENVMDLYNGIYDDKCTDPNDIEINTLKNEDGVEGGIFAKFKNNLSFIFGAYLNLFEHQSTINRNIPLRMLIYVAKLLSNMVETKQLYKEKAVKIPSPRFVVFYNGLKEAPEKETIRLSAQYGTEVKNPELELTVTVYNINTETSSDVLKKSRTLREYMEYVDRVRKKMTGLNDEAEKRKAMERVIDECIEDGILKKLLMERREEIIMTSILQYDQAAHEAALHEDGYDEGYDSGYDSGELAALIKLIGKKTRRGMDIPEIAGEIEEDESFVRKIKDIAERVSPEYDEKKVLEEYFRLEEKKPEKQMA